MAMATRLLLPLRSFTFSRPLPPAHIPASSSSGAQLGNGVLHRSPPGVRRHLHVLPTPVANNTPWFRGGSHRWHSSSSKSPCPRYILTSVLSVASFSATALLIDKKSSGDNQRSPPTGPLDHGSNKDKRKWTDTLLTVNLMVFTVDLATYGTMLSTWGTRVNELVKKGQIWRMITPCFLHSTLMHLAANNFALHDIGPMVEEFAGPRRFLTIYFTSALSGSLLSYFVGVGPSVGASSAICGLIGAQAVYMWRHREHLEKADETLWKIAFVVLVQAGFGYYSKQRINNWGHLGGLLGGAAVEWFVGPYWKKLGVAEDGTKVFQDRAPLVRLIPDRKTTNTDL